MMNKAKLKVAVKLLQFARCEKELVDWTEDLGQPMNYKMWIDAATIPCNAAVIAAVE